jgi:hypothetical protein
MEENDIGGARSKRGRDINYISSKNLRGRDGKRIMKWNLSK